MRPKDLEFYIYLMMSAKVNPNNDNIALHKMSLFPTLAQIKVTTKIQTPEGGQTAGFVDFLENHRPVSALQVSLSPSPVVVKSSPPESVWSKLKACKPSFSAYHISQHPPPPLQGRNSTNTRLHGMSVLNRMFYVETKW